MQECACLRHFIRCVLILCLFTTLPIKTFTNDVEKELIQPTGYKPVLWNGNNHHGIKVGSSLYI